MAAARFAAFQSRRTQNPQLKSDASGVLFFLWVFLRPERSRESSQSNVYASPDNLK
jgi:hypothetical protein